MENIIFIKNLVLFGIHGARSIETTIPRKFIFDIEVSIDSIQDAVESDDLNHAFDYNHIIEETRSVVSGQSVHLIETLATHIAETLLHYERVTKIKLTLSKCEDAETVSGITIERQSLVLK